MDSLNYFIRAKIHIHLYYAFVATVYWEASQGLVFQEPPPAAQLVALSCVIDRSTLQHARIEHVDRA